MERKFRKAGVAVAHVLMLLLIATLPRAVAQTVIIGSTSGTTSYDAGPTAVGSSFTTKGAHAYLYESGELGIPANSLITKIEWLRSDGNSWVNNSEFTIWMEQNGATTLSSTNLATLVSTATLVYNSTTQLFGAGANNWEVFNLQTPFAYTGSSLEIITKSDRKATNTNNLSYYVNTTTDKALHYQGNIPSDNNVTLNDYVFGDYRPTIRITYTPLTACSGTPAPTLSSSLNSVCPGTGYTLTAGPLGSSDITYQFQSSLDQSNWTNLGSPGSAHTYSIASQAQTTYYRVQATCGNSGLSAYSNEVTVTQNTPAACLCTPVADNGTTLSYISNFKTSGGVTNINNTSSSPTSSYQDFHTTASASNYPGMSVNYTITMAGTYGTQHAIWIDLNEDGVFQSTEKLVDNLSAINSPINGSFTVPAGTPAGTKRMRVLVHYGFATADPCHVSDYGEYEDYSFEVLQLSPCSGTPAPTLVSSAANVCPGVSYILTAGPVGLGGVTYQFESSPDNVNWTSLGAPAFSNTLNVAGQTATTYYRVTVTCSAPGGGSATSSVVSVLQNPPTECYCVPSVDPNYASSIYISNFTTTGAAININNTSTYSANGYQDFHSTISAQVYQGSTVGYTITTSGGTQRRAIWIDLNADGDFTDAGEQVMVVNTVDAGPFTGTFVIPSATTPGVKRMRVNINPFALSGPCGTTTYGEFEDYNIEVLPTPAPSITTFTPAAGCAASEVVITGTNFYGVSSVTINGVAVSSFVVVSPTTIKVRPPAGGSNGVISVTTVGGVATSTGAFTYAYPATPVVVATPNPVCLGQAVNLNASSTGATNIGWFTAATGGSYLGSSANGTNFTITPTSAGSFTYYAEGSSGTYPTGTILNGATSVTSSSGNFTVGYAFTPNTNLTVTAVKSYFGTKVSIWTAAGALIVGQPVSGTPGTWTVTPLATPVTLVAGTTYRIGAYSNSGTYYAGPNQPPVFANGTIGSRFYANGNGFVNLSTSGSNHWLVDLEYGTQGCLSATRTPITITVGNENPSITITPGAQMTTCGDAPVALNINIANATNPILDWNTLEGLYTDAAGSTPYTGGPATTVYAKRSTDIAYSVTVTSNGCAGTGTAATAQVEVSDPATPVVATATSTSTQMFTQLDQVNIRNADCELMASLNPSGAQPVSGMIDAMLVILGDAQVNSGFEPYVGRITTIAPQNDAATATATVTLYVTQAEFTAYNGKLPTLPDPAFWSVGPTSNTDLTGADNIRITQIHSDNSHELIDPATVFNTALNAWELTFPVSGFSSFYIHTVNADNSPLPVVLVDVTAANEGKRNKISWQSASEDRLATYIVEKSNDGKLFTQMAEVAAKGKAAGYITYDNAPNNGLTYYRLKMVDQDGTIGYSKTVSAFMNGRGAFALQATPNPTTGLLTITALGGNSSTAKVQITDVAGHVIAEVAMTAGKAEVNLSSVAAGVYFVKYADGSHSQTIKVTKQ